MRTNISIAAKLVIAYGLFLAPIGFLGCQMVSDKETNISFARKEISGVHYIAEVRSVQDAVVRGGDLAPLAERIKGNEQALGADLKTAQPTDALLKALATTDRAAAAQAAADLIGKAADGSNLTLDPDLDSFYTQDALTVKVPAAVAGVASLAAAVASTAGHAVAVTDQVSIGVQIGALQPTLDGLAADIGSAVSGNPDKTVDGALTRPVAQVAVVAKTVLASLADHARAADVQTMTRPLLDALTGAGAADAGEVEHLLNARIAGFRSAEMTDGGVALALFLAAVCYVLVVVQRGAIRPLRALTVTMSKLASHDLTVEIGGSGRGDEVGDMARAVQVFKENMLRADALTAERKAEQLLQIERGKQIESSVTGFEKVIAEVVGAVASASTELQSSAQAMAVTAEETSRQSTAVAAASEQASTNVQTVASTAEELSISVAEITRQVAVSAKICAVAVAEAAQTQQTMHGTAEMAQKIGAVVTLITDIAGQTNLLALNATIEAARAGDAGKGFAVVASEVKNLANQTAKATEEISAQIGAVQKASAESVRAIETISATIGRVNEIATAIASAIEEQGTATKAIARNVQQASEGTHEVSSNITGVSKAASQTGAASSQVLNAAGELSKQSEMLRSHVDQFLVAVRAA